MLQVEPPGPIGQLIRPLHQLGRLLIPTVRSINSLSVWSGCHCLVPASNTNPFKSGCWDSPVRRCRRRRPRRWRRRRTGTRATCCQRSSRQTSEPGIYLKRLREKLKLTRLRWSWRETGGFDLGFRIFDISSKKSFYWLRREKIFKNFQFMTDFT